MTLWLSMPDPIHTTVTASAVSWTRPLTENIFLSAAIDPHDNTAGEIDVRHRWPIWS
jgi:hypothetical protein